MLAYVFSNHGFHGKILSKLYKNVFWEHAVGDVISKILMLHNTARKCGKYVVVPTRNPYGKVLDDDFSYVLLKASALEIPH